MHRPFDRGIVLVVDGDPETRELYATALCLAEFLCAATDDPATARRWAQHTAFDAVVMDPELPRLEDGLSLAWALTAMADPPPLVAVTAHALSDVAPALFAARLLKPVDVNALVATVESVRRA